MSGAFGQIEARVWIMSFGLILILIGIALISSWLNNIFYFVLGFFVFMLGAGAFVTGFATARWDRPPVPKVRCRQCYTLNYETAMKCRKCGANMF